MTVQPYREPAPRPPDAPPSDVGRLGPLRSVHRPPPLHRALVGPVLLAGMALAAGGLLGLPLVAASATALVTLFALAIPPLRTFGHSVTLHADGVVVANRAGRSVLPFEEVNELWFDVSWLHSRAGAYLRGMRLVDFDGHRHDVPLAVDGGVDLTSTLLQRCSGALLREAKVALAEGAQLTFDGVQLDARGITVRGVRRAWSDVRLAVISHARIHLYGRRPLLAWRTVRLDRVPNPAVLACLVVRLAAQARIEDLLILPLAEVAEHRGQRGSGSSGLVDMMWGGITCAAGAVVTVVASSFASSSGYYFVACGPILYGAYRFIVGFLAWRSSPPR